MLKLTNGVSDEALGFLKAALETGLSKATFLHGSFGSGKSHFMAVLHRIMQGDPTARGLPKLAGVIPKHTPWLANRKFLLVPYYMIGKKDVARRRHFPRQRRGIPKQASAPSCRDCRARWRRPWLQLAAARDREHAPFARYSAMSRS